MSKSGLDYFAPKDKIGKTDNSQVGTVDWTASLHLISPC